MLIEKLVEMSKKKMLENVIGPHRKWTACDHAWRGLLLPLYASISLSKKKDFIKMFGECLIYYFNIM
jgi:hypothetical protein